MYTFLSILYVLICLFLILVVLLQPGRGGVGGAFGGGSSQTVFGGSGAGNFLTKLTSVSAALFMLLSATLAYMSSSSDKSLERAAEAARAKTAAKAAEEAKKKAAAKAARQAAKKKK
jgi:preprotein translocase subunit SecG